MAWSEDELIAPGIERLHGTIEDRLKALEAQQEAVAIASEIAWILLTATVVFLMQFGFALLESGMCRKNNTTATYTKNILDATLGSLIAFTFGYWLAYRESPMYCLWNTEQEIRQAIKVCAGFFHHLVFQATAATIMSGAMAERTTMLGYSILSCFVSAVPFSVVVSWTWGGGWLKQLGFRDFAGGAVVHIVGGAAATVGVYVVGPRNGRYDPRRFYEFLPQNVSNVMSGALVLWVGWYGFNMGSVSSLSTLENAHAAGNAAVTTTISGAVGAITSVVLAIIRSMVIGGHSMSVDAISLANGLLSGLVAITPGADCVSGLAALFVGVSSAAVYMLASAVMEALHIDDVVEAGAVHAACGAWGCLAVGLLHYQEGLFYGGGHRLLLCQSVGVIVIFVTAAGSTLVVALLLRRLQILRVTLAEEAKGLDHKFGVAASSFHYNRAQRMRHAASVIESSGHTISDIIEALLNIKQHIIMPFSPQASDLVIEGQVSDILSRLDHGLDVSFASERTYLSRRMLDELAGQAANGPAVTVSSFKRGFKRHLCFAGQRSGDDNASAVSASSSKDSSNSRSPAGQRGAEKRLDRVREATRRHLSIHEDATPTPSQDSFCSFSSKDTAKDSLLLHRFAKPLFPRPERAKQGGAPPPRAPKGAAAGRDPPPSEPSKWSASPPCNIPPPSTSPRVPPPSLPAIAASPPGAQLHELPRTEVPPTVLPPAELRQRSTAPPIKFLAFFSHHKLDGGDAARVFVDTARRIVLGDGVDGLSAEAALASEDLIFLDSSNLSDLRRLLEHVEESANYILMLTRTVLERPWVLAELVRAHTTRRRMVVISPSWPGDDSSPQGRMFRFPQHLDDVIDEWQEYYYEATLRQRALAAAAFVGPRSCFAKAFEGSVLFQRMKVLLEMQEC